MNTKVLLTLWICLAIPSTSFSQNTNNPNDEVTLVVSADGATKEEATKVALRSAIEQAYGTFVSANTTILNDDLVKDEIVTISNGNIKNYEEVASAMLPNGNQSVTLKATVCISKLVSYAQSKGASTEFAGATFAMNMKMKELNKKNEMVALENLLVQIKELLPYAYDRVLEVDEPKLAEGINASDYYEMNMKVRYQENSNTRNFFLLIGNTLSSLSLTEAECEEMQKLNIDVSRLWMYFPYNFYFAKSNNGCDYIPHLRTAKKELKEWVIKVRHAFRKNFTNFAITDNLGGKSSFDKIDKFNLGDSDNPLGYSGSPTTTTGNGLFHNGVSIKYFFLDAEYGDFLLFNYGGCYENRSINRKPYISMKFNIRKDEIMKYTNFAVERKE